MTRGSIARVGMLALLSMGCSGEPLPEEEEVGTTDHEIRNGTKTLEYGVVGIRFSTGHICTGAIIGWSHIITAAHCLVGQFPGREGHFKGTITYFDPETGPRPISRTNEVMIGYYKSTYNTKADTDPESDIGLIFRGGSGSVPTAKTWDGVSMKDFLRLSHGKCELIEGSEFYGQGLDGFSKDASAGTLRKTWVIIDDCHKHYFKHISGDAQVCSGDSGGPYLVTLADGTRAIAGLLSYSDGNRNCTTWPYGEYAMRINDDKVTWLESKMGRKCSERITDGHRNDQCWSTLGRPR